MDVVSRVVARSRRSGPASRLTLASACALVLVSGGCREPELSLPPPKSPTTVGPAAPVADPLPPLAPRRPTFPPSGGSDAARREAAIRDDAFDVAETLLAQSPDDAAGWLLLGVVHERFGDPAGATVAWEQALARDPRQVMAHRCLGDAAAARGAMDVAEHHYREAIAIDPDALSVVDRLAETLVARGDLPGANDLLSSFVVGRPGIVEGWCLLGKIRLLMGKPEAARTAFRRALQIDPSAMDAVGGLADSIRAEAGVPLEVSIGRRLADRGAAGRDDRRLQDVPDSPLEPWAATVNFWAGRAFSRLGDTTRAAICWRRAIELDPGDGDSREALALLLENTDRTRDAMRVRQEWCDAEPDNPSAWFGRGKLALALGLTDAAAESLRRAVALSPGRAEGYALLSVALSPSDPAGSLDAARRAADIDPSARTLLLLAETLARLGENASAEAAAERALALDARDPRARDLLGRLRRDAGRDGDARRTPD